MANVFKPFDQAQPLWTASERSSTRAAALVVNDLEKRCLQCDAPAGRGGRRARCR